MNERIRELMVEAGIYECDDFEPHPTFEKFAELIVQKFDDILVLEYLDCVGSQDNQSKQRIKQLREKAKTYFGIEK